MLDELRQRVLEANLALPAQGLVILTSGNASGIDLEQVAQTALLTSVLVPDAGPLPEAILSKHFERKHGPSAYYGQR